MASNVDRLAQLFEGLPRAHGRSVVTGRVNQQKKKAEARSSTVLEPVTRDLWRQHLAGSYGLGVIPVTDDATVKWGAIDVDEYDLDLVALENRVRDLKLPLVTCRTKSGGAHLYLFLTEHLDSQTVKNKVTDLAVALGYGGCEIFPKQVALAHDKDVGSWLNMPYQNEKATKRYAIINGKPADLSTFLDLAEKVRVDGDQLTQLNPPVSSDFKDGPPCLQQLSTHGFPDGTRNNSLFNIGVYATLKWPDDWERRLEEYNHEYMDPPLSSSEVQVIIKSLNKKNYRYRCGDQPLCDACNHGLCLGRRYGVAGGGAQDEPHDVQLGSLTKYLTDPPTYVLDVDGHRIELLTDELLEHPKFRRKCFERLNKLPPRRKSQTWDKIVQQLVSNCEEVDAPDDASPDGRVWQLLEDWCTRYGLARTREEMLVGKPWTEDGWTYFRAGDFQRFLDHQGMRDVKGRRLWTVLRQRGADHGSWTIDGRCVRWWKVPAFNHEQVVELQAPRKQEDY